MYGANADVRDGICEITNKTDRAERFMPAGMNLACILVGGVLN